MSLLKKLASETAIYGMSYILGRMLNYIIIGFYLTHKVSEMDYAIYNDLYFYVALILIFLTFRMETTYFRFSKEQDKISTFTSSQFIIISLTTLWLILSLTNSQGIASFLQYPDKSHYIQLLAIVIGLDAVIAVPFAKLRMDNRPLVFGLLKLGQIIVNVGMVLVFLEVMPRLNSSGINWISNYYHANDPILDVFIANLIASGLAFLIMLPAFKHFKINKINGSLKKMTKYAIPLVLVGLAGVINQNAYITLQKYNLVGDLSANLTTAGVYAAAFKIALMLSLFTTGFNFAAEPFFFQNSDHKDAKAIYSDVAKAYAIFASFIIIMIMMYINWIPFILGEKFRSGMSVAPILLMAFFFLGIYYNFSIWFKIKDKTIYGTYIAIMGVVVTIGLNILLLPKIGEIGSAWTSFGCYLTMATAALLFGRKHFPVPYPILNLIAYPLMAIGVYYLSNLSQDFFGWSEIQMFLQNTILVLIFIGCLLKYEWNWLKGALNRV